MSRVRFVLAILAIAVIATAGVLAARTLLGEHAADTAAASRTAPANSNGQIPDDQLVEIETGHRLIAPAADAFAQLKQAAHDAGHDLSVNSAYRDLAEQAKMIDLYGLLEDGGRAAPLGESEHGDGTSVDLTLNTEALMWMREHAPTFGFFETISGEPWHWTWQAG